jgi:hypothetical protein
MSSMTLMTLWCIPMQRAALEMWMTPWWLW